MSRTSKKAFTPAITYDPDADAVAIDLAPTPKGALRVTRALLAERPDLRADFVGEQLMGFEILGASAFFAPEVLARFGPAAIEHTLAEAAALAKLNPTTLRVLVNQGKLPARKKGRDWLVKESDLWNYVESRSPAGRPAADPKARKVRRPKASRG